MTFSPLPEGLYIDFSRNVPPSDEPCFLTRLHDKEGVCELCLMSLRIPQNGLFASRAFPKGHNFGFARNQTEQPYSDGSVRIQCNSREPLSNYVNCDDDNPNCEITKSFRFVAGNGDVDLVAIRDIQPGDELMVSYTLFAHGSVGNRPWDRQASDVSGVDGTESAED